MQFWLLENWGGNPAASGDLSLEMRQVRSSSYSRRRKWWRRACKALLEVCNLNGNKGAKEPFGDSYLQVARRLGAGSSASLFNLPSLFLGQLGFEEWRCP